MKRFLKIFKGFFLLIRMILAIPLFPLLIIWYGEIDKLTGVPKEIMEISEHERELDAIDPLRIR